MSVLRVKVVNVRLSGYCLIDSDGGGGGKNGIGRGYLQRLAGWIFSMNTL